MIENLASIAKNGGGRGGADRVQASMRILEIAGVVGDDAAAAAPAARVMVVDAKLIESMQRQRSLAEGKG